jgi:solute:Na+ symporter, SSS family
VDRRAGSRRREKSAPGSAEGSAEFALAGRRLSGPLLLATLAASNLSAFTVFGVSGASYRLGWAFFPVMAFGTAFMAVSFAVIGIPLRRMSAERGWVTPGEFIADRFGSPLLGRLFSGLSLAYTIPYLAIQAGVGGRLLAAMTGLPPPVCSALLVGFVTAYVYKGGMRSVARTDIIQLAALVVLAVLAGVIVLRAAGPMGAVGKAAADTARMSRAGVGGTLGWLPLLGYYALWGLADPMFPHFIQRFYAARSDRALLSSMVAYPVVAVLVFLPVCAIGVLGSAMLPGMTDAASDGIFTALTAAVAGPVWGPVFSVAALAALMSTMDSQLLSCASMVTTDFLPPRLRGPGASALAAVGLAAGAWLVSIDPPASILGFLGKTAFPGYASLAPVAIAGIYARRTGRWPAAAGLVAGTALVVFQALGAFTPPFPAALFNAVVQVSVMALVAFLPRAGHRERAPNPGFGKGVSGRMVGVTATVTLAGVLGVDFWNYNRTSIIVLGLPGWMVYHILLTLALGFAFHACARCIQTPPPESSRN